MKILIACEESQTICKEMRAVGNEAYSCDLVECSGGHKEWHIKQDVIPLLNGNCSFNTMDGISHTVIGKWDLIIARPPCTRLCNSGQRWLYFGSSEYRNQKLREQQKEISLFLQFTKAECDRIVIENPVGIMSSIYRKPNQIYNPYDFEGETECKKTCLWLKGVRPLVPTQSLPKEQRTRKIYHSYFGNKFVEWGTAECKRLRRITPKGVAKAMAEQWGK